MKHGHKMPLRFLSLLLTALMLVSIAPVSVFADGGEPTIQVGSATAFPGGTVTIDIKLKDNPGIASAAVNVSFDSNVLMLQKITYGEPFAANGEQPETMISPVTLSWSNLSNISDDVTFASLEFSVSAAAPEGTTNITLSYDASNIINIDEDDIDFQIENGSIEVVNGIPGDINADGERNMKDLLRARKYFAGWDVETDPIALDATGDGSVNIKDLLRLRKFFANWYVPIYYGAIIVYPTSSTIQYVAYKAPTCEVAGNIAYWYNSTSGKYYSDAAGTTEITQESTVLAATGHTPVTDPAVGATYTSTGLTEGSHCSVCQKVLVAQEVVPILTGTQWSITYNIAGNDSYLKSIAIDNPNPSIYTEGIGVTLEELEVDGYIFEGWYDGQGSSASRVTKITSSDSGNKKLYAHWSKATYTIKFDCGDIVTIDPINYTVGTTTPLPTPKKTNYTFVGWTDEYGQLIKNLPEGTTGDITLYANWSSKRNQTKPHDYSNETPIILEDTDAGIILFAYEIGTIENVPLYQIGDTMNAVAGLTQVTTETKEDIISESTAKTITQAISSATTNSAAWSLTNDWNTTTAVDSTYAKTRGYEVKDAEELAKTSSGQYSLNSSIGGAKTTTDTAGYSYKLGETQKHSESDDTTKETGQNFGLSVDRTKTGGANVSGGYEQGGWNIGASLASGIANKLGIEYENYEKTTDTHTETDEWTNTVELNVNESATFTNEKNWNMEAGYEFSNSVSKTHSISETLSELISEEKHYGESYSTGGSHYEDQEFSTTDSSTNGWSDTTTYSSEVKTTYSTTINLTGEVEGYYRFVCAGKVHVFAVVGYDVANKDYFVYTYNVVDDDTYIFTDYSAVTPSFDDNENGVLSFEVPYYVNQYVNNRIAKTDGLVVEKTGKNTGTITGYTGTSKLVIIPSYVSFDNRDGTYTSIKVTGISENAFRGNTTIVGVKFSDYITEIPDNAFSGCTALEGIYAPGVTQIGSNAFANCSSLKKFNVTSYITNLGSKAFDGVSSVSVVAADASVALAAANCGAKNITVNIASVADIKNGTTFTIPEGTESFELQGGQNSFSDLQIVSDAVCTVVNGVTFDACTRTPLIINSTDLILSQVNAYSSGYCMLLSADNTSIDLYGTSSLVSDCGIAIISKNVSFEGIDASVDTKINVSGNVLTYGTLTGGSYLAMTSGEIKTINKDEYDLYEAGLLTIALDATGGVVDTAIKTAYCGVTLGTLPTPTRTGYSFDGWFTAADGGEQVTAETKYYTAEDVTIYAHWTALAYSVNWSTGTGYSISVSRTESPCAGAATGALDSGATVYFGDVLSISYGAWEGYTLAQNGATTITVSGDIAGDSIWASVSANSYTYDVVYYSSNGTYLGGTTVSGTWGSSQTISAPYYAGYNTPGSQTITWDATSKTVTFYYSIVGQSTSQSAASDWWWQSGSGGITYAATVEYQNRTSSSVQVRVIWVQSIKAAAYGYNQYFNSSIGGVSTGDIQIATTSTWPFYSSSGPWHTNSVTVNSGWITVPVSATATSVYISTSWWDQRGSSGSWGYTMAIPTY